MPDEKAVNAVFKLSLFPLRESWPGRIELCRRELCPRGEVSELDALFAKLMSDYERPPRAYHIFGHALETLRIGASLGELAGLRLEAEDAAAFAVAALCHDVVYERGAADNEERSAVYASSFCGALGLSESVAAKASAAVLATKHPDREPSDALEALIRDADLSVLASPPERYADYASLIRQEAGAIDAAAYARGRGLFLAAFLDRRRLFFLEGVAEVLEAAARRNLGAELELLQR